MGEERFDGSMGLGKLGGPTLVFKRKFRWIFEIKACSGTVPRHFVRIAGRPNLAIEETEINYLNAKSWIPGKAAWQTMEVTYYDVATIDNMPLWNWLAGIYNFMKPDELPQHSMRKDWEGEGTLTLLDGCGTLIEEWTLKNMFPTAVNFGELDMSSNDICDIVLTLRYSDVTYKPLCVPNMNPCPCTPCGG